MHQERNPTTVSQLLAQIRELQNNVNSLSDAREFHIMNQGAALERPTFPPSRDSGLPHDTRNGTGIPGNVFESFLALAQDIPLELCCKCC